ncbi:MAG: YaeQ family protein [Duodenibacillus sp.]|nr:YaeQ family protein [Duodenibacillus sp.]
MALGATIYKAIIDLSDMDRNVYGSWTLTLARHPSETEARLMVRLLAWCLYADDRLEFGRGIACEEDADVWERDAGGDIVRWIAVGTPDNKALRRAAGRSREVALIAYDEARIGPWWAAGKKDFAKLPKLSVRRLSDADVAQLEGLAGRQMRLTVTIQDGTVWISGEAASAEVTAPWMMRAGEPED